MSLVLNHSVFNVAIVKSVINLGSVVSIVIIMVLRLPWKLAVLEIAYGYYEESKLVRYML